MLVRTPHEVNMVEHMQGDIYRCPNRGFLIYSCDPQDDKVLCPCGQENPVAPHKHFQEAVTSGMTHHLKRFLETVTLEQARKEVQ